MRNSIVIVVMLLVPLYLMAASDMTGDTEAMRAMLEKKVAKEKKHSVWYEQLDFYYNDFDLTDKRIELLKKGMSVKNMDNPDLIKYRLAIALFDAGRYDESLELLNSMKQTKPIRKALENCKAAKYLKQHPVNATIEYMGDSINTPYDNIWPFIDNDKKRFYTTVVVGKSTFHPKSMDIQEDIFYSDNTDNGWLPVRPLQGEIRSNENEGACCITSDGKYMFFTSCNQHGNGGCEIDYSINKNGKWSKPIRGGGELNKFSWQSTPSISADGSTLYFSAVDDNKPKNSRSGATDKDIYSCSVSYNKDGSLDFSNVKRLGSEINTEYDEISPFINPYNNILYFSSDGRGGMGGLDVFFSKRSSDGTWQKAQNIGYPINTYRDEFGFIVDVNGENGYMSCNRLADGKFWENKRIVRIALTPEHRSGSGLEEKGSDFVLDNIYFDIDKSEVTTASYPYLDLFVEYLKVHARYSVTISGHTDETGTFEHNMKLSKARADSVAAYLIAHGIDSSRITTVGYGASKPISSTDNKLNRRIQIELK